MSHVHYKFKSSLDHATVTFDGLSISLGDLKKAIMTTSKLPKSSDFDLQVVNAQTHEVYKNDTDLIGRNKSVIVTRVPVGSSGTGDEGPSVAAGSKGKETAKSTMDRLNKAVDLTKVQGSEEEKIMAMMNQAAQDYSEANYIVKTRAPPGQPPATYVCYRCGVRGHWIQNCPMQYQQKPDTMAFPGTLRGVKKTHGIPQSFLLPATKDTPGAMLTAIGTYAVPRMDAEAYARGKKEKPAFTDTNDPALMNPEKKIPKELLCTLCNELLRDATIVPCCGVSFCDECVRNSLVEGDDDQECPSCKELIVPDQLIPNKFLRSAVTNFLSESNVQPRMHVAVPGPSAIAVTKPLPEPTTSSSPAYSVAVKAEPSPVLTTDEGRPATPVVDEKPDASADHPAVAAGVGQSTSETTAGSSTSSTDAQGQAVPVIGKTYANPVAEGSTQRHAGSRGSLQSRGLSRPPNHSSGAMHPGHAAAMMHGAPVLHGHLPYGMPRFRPMTPAMSASAPPMPAGFGPRAAPFPMYAPAPIPPMMYVPAPPQHIPGGTVLTAEEFYKEKARLLEEELHKQKKSDPMDDFARELLEYRKDQRKRQRSRSLSRSRSRSRKRSGSRSPKRNRYRSRSRSRTRSPYYKRSPGFYRRSSRSPYQKFSPSSVTTSSPPLEYAHGGRSLSPYSKYHHLPPARDKYMDEYYRRYMDDYFRRADPHYDPRYFDEYYRSFYERYARGSPHSEAYGLPRGSAAAYVGSYPLPHHDGERGSTGYHQEAHQRHGDSSRSRGRNGGSRTKLGDRSRYAPSGNRRRSRERIVSSERQRSKEHDTGSRSARESDKDKHSGRRDKKKREGRACAALADAPMPDKNAAPSSLIVTDSPTMSTQNTSEGDTTTESEERRSKQKKSDSKRKREPSTEKSLSSDDEQKKSKRLKEKRERSEVSSVSAASGSPMVQDAAALPSEATASTAESSISMLPSAATEHDNRNDAGSLTSASVDKQQSQDKECATVTSVELHMDTPSQCGDSASAGGSSSIALLEAPAAKQEAKRKRVKSPNGGGSDKTRLKKKRKPASSIKSSMKPCGSADGTPLVDNTADSSKEAVSTAAADTSSPDVLIKPPELSRWEREDQDEHETELSPRQRMPAEKLKPQSLPRSVIESAEKAFMSKQPKPLIASAVSVLSASGSTNSARALSSTSVSSVGTSSRKVLVGLNKESSAAMAHESGVATDRKVHNVASSVRITISQDKGLAEDDDSCKDLREKLKKVKDNVPDSKDDGRRTDVDKEAKIDKNRYNKDDQEPKKHRDQKTEAAPGHSSRASINKSNAVGVPEQKRSLFAEVAPAKSSHGGSGRRERHSSQPLQDAGYNSHASRDGASGKSRSAGKDSESASTDWSKDRKDELQTQSYRSGGVRHDRHHDPDDAKQKGNTDSKQSKRHDAESPITDRDQSGGMSTNAPIERSPAVLKHEGNAGGPIAAVRTQSIPAESKSLTLSNGPADKAAAVASAPSSVRLSDEASFNPDYDETTTQSSGGSESALSDDEEEEHSARDSVAASAASGDVEEQGQAETSSGQTATRQRHSEGRRAKSSRSKHKKHKKHTKKHKKHKKHKKSSSTKIE